MPTPIHSIPETWPALVEFLGFSVLPGIGARAGLLVWLPTGGSPAEMAHWFSSALALNAAPEHFAASCLASGPAPWRPLPASPMNGQSFGAVVGSHRYRLALGGRGRRALRLQCWRCYPCNVGWQRRCGPMSLRAFIRHFADRSPAWGSAAEASGPQPPACGATSRSSAPWIASLGTSSRIATVPIAVGSTKRTFPWRTFLSP